jgi:hypothetical protein
MRTYMHMCLNTCIHASIYAYVPPYMHTCEHICICASIHAYNVKTNKHMNKKKPSTFDFVQSAHLPCRKQVLMCEATHFRTEACDFRTETNHFGTKTCHSRPETNHFRTGACHFRTETNDFEQKHAIPEHSLICICTSTHLHIYTYTHIHMYTYI